MIDKEDYQRHLKRYQADLKQHLDEVYQIHLKRYRDDLNKYLQESGPNNGTGFFGKWAWDAEKEKEFKEKLKNK